MSLLRLIFFYFIVYSFLGWVIEGLFNLATRGSFVKPNFLYAPLKPMYGIASLLLIGLKSFAPIWIFIPCLLLIPSFVEYMTGYLLFYLFKLKYWDYTHCPYHLSGYVCLRFSIYWFFLSFILIYFIHPIVSFTYPFFYFFWIYAFPIFLLLFLTDSCLSIKQKNRPKN